MLRSPVQKRPAIIVEDAAGSTAGMRNAFDNTDYSLPPEPRTAGTESKSELAVTVVSRFSYSHLPVNEHLR